MLLLSQLSIEDAKSSAEQVQPAPGQASRQVAKARRDVDGRSGPGVERRGAALRVFPRTIRRSLRTG
jgi:hypothetical protein